MRRRRDGDGVAMRRAFCWVAAAVVVAAVAPPAGAQPLLYVQGLPEGTVYIRLANALPGAANVATDFAGAIDLGADGATRISPYYVAGQAGGKPMALEVNQAGRTSTATFQPKAGSFTTVVLHPDGSGVRAAVITDKPEYNQLKARLSFYNATPDCAAGSLAERGRPVFSAVPHDGAEARSVNPAKATVTASCAADAAPPLPLGQLEAGGLYTVWMMQPAGRLTAFVAHDLIAPPRS